MSGHETPLAMPVAASVAVAGEVEELWGNLISVQLDLTKLTHHTETASLRAALLRASDMLHEAGKALGKASAIARRDGR